MNLPPVIKDAQEAFAQPVELKEAENIVVKDVDARLKDKIVICLTRDLKKDDLLVLQSYGKVILYENCYNNIELDQLDFLYLLIDIRQAPDRLYYQKHVAQLNVKKVLFRHSFEDDLVMNVNVERTKLPAKQATHDMYVQLLFQQQLAKPRVCWSFFKKFLMNSKI